MAGWGGVDGRRVVLTGATRGIGLAAAEELAARGARLTIVARDGGAAQAALARIDAASPAGARAEVLMGDLASQSAIRALAAELLARHARIDVLVNNAGAINTRRRTTVDGVELTWAVNHLAPFLLTTLLLERIRESAPARIITTSSGAHVGARIPFEDGCAEPAHDRTGFRRYGQTKLANILFTAELARILAGTAVSANCFHPGLVASGFNRNNGRLAGAAMLLARPFSRSPAEGARALVWLADSEAAGEYTGGYFMDERRVTPSAAAQDVGAARRLWELSERQVAASV